MLARRLLHVRTVPPPRRAQAPRGWVDHADDAEGIHPDSPRSTTFSAPATLVGIPIDGPDPECVDGHGEAAMLAASVADRPRPMMGHSKPVRVATPERVPVTLGRR